VYDGGATVGTLSSYQRCDFGPFLYYADEGGFIFSTVRIDMLSLTEENKFSVLRSAS
jgi:hypothetical protein